MWWLKPVVPALGRLRQEDGAFQANLNYGKRGLVSMKQCNTILDSVCGRVQVKVRVFTTALALGSQ